MKFREVRQVSSSDIRNLCTKENWYTTGSNKQYEHLLLDLCEWKENLTTEDIVEIAKDIIDHSEFKADGRTEAEVIESVAFEVMRVCKNYIIRVKE